MPSWLAPPVLRPVRVGDWCSPAALASVTAALPILAASGRVLEKGKWKVG